MTIYRGSEGMWAWTLHRIAGVAIFLFLILHIGDTALIGWGPALYDKFVKFYSHALFRIGEIGLGAALLFHALNGIRVIIIDFWEGGTALQKRLFYAAAVFFVIIFVPGAYIMARSVFAG
jgi:succinate dehydrogenase / fumarate reductase, cytochrome b subunit